MATDQYNPETPIAAHQVDWANPRDDALVAFVKGQYTAAKQRRGPWERQAAVNQAFASGNQNVKWNDVRYDLESETLVRDGSDPSAASITVNTITGFVLQRMAMVVGVPLTWKCHPWTTDDEDVSSARVGNKLLQHLFAGADPTLPSRFLQAIWTMFVTGVVFARVTWDPDRGGERAFKPPEGEGKGDRWLRRIAESVGLNSRDLQLGPDGSYVAHEGDPHVEFRTGFHISEPVRCCDPSEAAWLIDSEWIEKEKLIERYGPAKAKDLTADSDSEAFRAGWAGEYGFAKDADYGSAPAEHVLIHNLWRPGTKRYPKGYRAVVADEGKVLQKGSHPYHHARIPFVAMRDLPERRFRPASMVTTLIEPQAVRNRLYGSIGKHVHTTVDPKTLVAKEANVPVDFLATHEPRQHECDGDVIARAVVPVKMPSLPSHVFPFDEALRRAMMEAARVHDSTLGQSESAQQSGRHAQLLQQSDARANSVSRQLLERAMGDVGRLELCLYVQFVSEERAVTICGADSRHEVVRFKGEDLLGTRKGDTGAATFNVEVSIVGEPDVGTVYERVEMLVRSGLRDPRTSEADRIELERMIGQVAAREFDEASKQRSNASEEHERLMAGDAVEEDPGDWDPTHIDEHKRWTTTAEFRKARERDKTIDERLILHIREHEYAMASDRQRAAFLEAITHAELTEEFARRAADCGAQLPPAPHARPAGIQIPANGGVRPGMAGMPQGGGEFQGQPVAAIGPGMST